MKNISFITLLVLLLAANRTIGQTNTFPSTGAAGIGTLTPNASSSLEILSTNTGLLIPRMTRSQRNSIASPATGLLIFQTTNKPGFYYFDGIGWVDIGSNSANKSLGNLNTNTSVNSSLIPDVDDSLDLGKPIKEWRGLYANNIYQNGDLTIHSTGPNNIFAGKDAGNGSATGSVSGEGNTGIGASTLFSLSFGVRNTAIGREALYSNDLGNNNAAVGYRALYSNGDGIGNIGIGSFALTSNTSGSSNIAIGKNALGNNTAGFKLIAIGDSALFNQGNNSFDDYDNVAIGHLAMFTNDYGYLNTAVGGKVLYNNDIGHNNAAYGYEALFSNTNGTNNVAIGNHTLYSMNQGDYNSAVGTDALYHANSFNSNLNSAFGNRALYNTTTNDSNTACGSYAGYTNSTGSGNTFLGTDADASIGTLTNATSIGYGATVSASNSTVLGNSKVTGWGFGVAPGNRAIKVGTTASNGNGAYLTLGGVWTNGSARSKKEDFQQMDKNEILLKINQLEVTKWKYKGTADEYHYGPMAEDFYRLFKVGDDASIADMDKTGVLLLGVQALSEENARLLDGQGKLSEGLLTAKNENSELKGRIEELNSAISELRNKVDQLEEGLSQCCIAYSQFATDSKIAHTNDQPKLEQNVPNPFNQNTIISFYLPQNTGHAAIKIYSLDGVELKSFEVNQSGFGEIALTANTLPSGVYAYTLIIDGKAIDNRQMILTK